ncbi:MAG: branched-chain amino acid ABC transporter permease [Caldilineaceae bacterium]|nr:branched-chain amino acid ABC transporter permease [Caldilineaceae bacterium]
MQQVRSQRMTVSPPNQVADSATSRPEVIANWVIVTAVEAFLLLALTPALFAQYGAFGWLGLGLGALMAVLSAVWYRGVRIGYPALVLFYAVSMAALVAAGVVFLTALPIVTALVFLALALITAGAFARGDRRAGAILALILVIGFVVLFASASRTERDQLTLTLLLVGLYLLTGGAVSFLFSLKFSDLRSPVLLSFFGYTAEPQIVQVVTGIKSRLQGWLSSFYAILTSGVGPAQRIITAGRAQIAGQTQRIPYQARRTSTIILIALALLFFPLFVRWLETTTNLSLLITMNVGLLFVVLALGLNIVVGFAGLLDLGYAAFFAIGAYTVGIFTWPNLGLEWSFWVVIWISAIVAAIFGLIIGTPTLRLRGDYLAIVTLAFGEIVPRAIREMWDIRLKIPFTDIYLIGSELRGFNLTNGPQGMNPVGRPIFFGYEIGIDPIALGPVVISPPMQWYFLIILMGALVLIAALRLEKSRLGRAWMAIREDETVADAMGVDPIRTKLLAFALGASFSGFAGSIYAAMIQAIFPELFSFLVSIFLLIIVIVSGMGNIWGVLLGGLIISLFDRVALAQIVPQYVPGGDVLQSWRWVMYAAGLIAIMILRPEGLFPSKARQAELHDAEEADLDAVVYLQDEVDEPTSRDLKPSRYEHIASRQKHSRRKPKRKR